MNETSKTEDKSGSDMPVHLLSEELEEATNIFLTKIEELEKLLSMVDE